MDDKIKARIRKALKKKGEKEAEAINIKLKEEGIKLINSNYLDTILFKIQMINHDNIRKECKTLIYKIRNDINKIVNADDLKNIIKDLIDDIES